MIIMGRRPYTDRYKAFRNAALELCLIPGSIMHHRLTGPENLPPSLPRPALRRVGWEGGGVLWDKGEEQC